MTMQFCPYCKCLILSNGKCRNNKCIMGISGQASEKQIAKIQELRSELNVPDNGWDPSRLTKTQASKTIKKLIAEKAFREMYGSEEKI